jgi:hypothetical protein
MQSAEKAGYISKDVSSDVDLGDRTHIAVSTKDGQRVYTAHFASGRAVGIVIVAGNRHLTQRQAFDILSLAAESTGRSWAGASTVETIQGFEAFVGEWHSKGAKLAVKSDGTGEMNFNSGCCVGMGYDLEVDVQRSPLTATIIDRSFWQVSDSPSAGLDEDQAARPGDVLTFGFESGENGDLVVVIMPPSERNFVHWVELCQLDKWDPRCG